jgi:hypothetical protein
MTTYTDCTRLVGGRDCLERHAPTLCPACFAFAEREGVIFAAEVDMERAAIVNQLRLDHVVAYPALGMGETE